MIGFDFSDSNLAIQTIVKIWNDFRNSLASGKFNFDDIDSARKTMFIQSMENVPGVIEQLEVDLDFIFKNYKVVRAANINKSSTPISYNRFIPDALYIIDHNRFSPPGIEWLYLALGAQIGDKSSITIAQETALQECRPKKNDKFAVCHFNMNKQFKNNMIVDLTIANNISRQMLEKQLYIKCRISEGDKRALIDAFSEFYFLFLVKILSQEIFKPLNTNNKALEYAPFQCMAKYFQSKGFDGIVYSSTVYPKGKNLVLFNKNMATPIGDIITLQI